MLVLQYSSTPVLQSQNFIALFARVGNRTNDNRTIVQSIRVRRYQAGVRAHCGPGHSGHIFGAWRWMAEPNVGLGHATIAFHMAVSDHALVIFWSCPSCRLLGHQTGRTLRHPDPYAFGDPYRGGHDRGCYAQWSSEPGIGPGYDVCRFDDRLKWVGWAFIAFWWTAPPGAGAQCSGGKHFSRGIDTASFT
jgi:hypothetical protein